MNILTFDIEEWFHILQYGGPNYKNTWDSLESRIISNMNHIFDILKKTDSRASFFIVGWIGKKYPQIVREINDLGYHIGTHSDMHELAYDLNPDQFRKDVENSIEIISSITNLKVDSYRAPGFSIKKSNIQYLKILMDLGISIDCSIFTGTRSHGGIKNFPYTKPFILTDNEGRELIELPTTPARVFSLFPEVVTTGGGYFRFFPKNLISYSISKNEYNMFYFHPRDFDTGQPRLNKMSLIKFFKTYVGIKSCKSKLISILSQYPVCDIPAYLKDSSTVKNFSRVNLNNLFSE